MAYFDHTRDFMVKMTKCRQMLHTQMSREGVTQIPPHVTQQAAPVTCSSSGFRAVFSTTLVLSVLHLIMTETGF